MFKEFNVKFEDAEMVGGADNLLEGTEVTKVILRGDNKLSSLDSTFKNCSQLDIIDGELDLRGVSDIDELLEGTSLVKNIELKNVNNKNITANNAFPHIDQITIGGEVYNKEAIQNVIGSREWTFNNINYVDTVGENIITHAINISEGKDDIQTTIDNPLEQKARGIEIKGQTYQNLIQGKEGAELLADIKFENIEGKPSKLSPIIDHPISVEVIEGQTYQNLINGKGNYNLTDSYSATWTEFSPLGIQPNKEYTLQLDSTGKNDKPIIANLGGAEITIQPTNNIKKHHKAVIRTSSRLTTDNLELFGEGVVVNDVMLFEGGESAIKQEVEYIEGIQSIGELQEDGSYKIDILTSNLKQNLNTSYCEYDVLPFKTSFNPTLTEYITLEFVIDNISNSNIIKDQQGVNLYIEGNELKVSTFSFDEGFSESIIGSITSNDVICLIYEKSNIIKIYINGSLRLSQEISPSGTIEVLSKLKYLGVFEHKIEQSDMLTFAPSKSVKSIILPHPLNKIGDKKDKLYWDEDKGHYCVEQNVITEIFKCDNFSNTGFDYRADMGVTIISFKNDRGIVYPNLLCDKLTIVPNGNLHGSYLKNFDSVGVTSDGYIRFIFWKEMSKSNFKEILDSLNMTFYYTSSTPTIIDLLHLNQKYSLDTYLPETYVKVDNAPMQPSRMYFETDKLRYKPIALETNKEYTIQFNCSKNSDTNIKFNLGGAEKELKAIIGVNHIDITTPKELSSDRLYIFGQGNKVSDVMLINGNMKQYPEYFEGTQSVGELEEDGSYKIDIKTNEDFILSIKLNDPLAKDDRLYWNEDNRRYEVDRNGVIEIPVAEGNIIDLPRLYQKLETYFNVTSGNLQPSDVVIEYKDNI